MTSVGESIRFTFYHRAKRGPIYAQTSGEVLFCRSGSQFIRTKYVCIETELVYIGRRTTPFNENDTYVSQQKLQTQCI